MPFKICFSKVFCFNFIFFIFLNFHTAHAYKFGHPGQDKNNCGASSTEVNLSTVRESDLIGNIRLCVINTKVNRTIINENIL